MKRIIMASTDWNSIYKSLSLDTPDKDVDFMLGNLFSNANVEKVNALLGREDNDEGYPLPGKAGIDYKDASPRVKQKILNIIKQDGTIPRR